MKHVRAGCGSDGAAEALPAVSVPSAAAAAPPVPSRCDATLLVGSPAPRQALKRRPPVAVRGTCTRHGHRLRRLGRVRARPRAAATTKEASLPVLGGPHAHLAAARSHHASACPPASKEAHTRMQPKFQAHTHIHTHNFETDERTRCAAGKYQKVRAHTQAASMVGIEWPNRNQAWKTDAMKRMFVFLPLHGVRDHARAAPPDRARSHQLAIRAPSHP